MLLELETFTIETALDAATELRKVLAARTHRRKVMGQEVMVPGQLGEALQLPRIINRLQSKQMKQRELGLEDFQELWPTLSPQTRERVLGAIGWYDPKELDWDDKRSNRRPLVDPDS
ncbi:hypothetical protein SAMN04487869_102313 [Marinobacter sp. DSM 26671]|jgi:hypothetical protein|uniref:Uncharacterized protein n=4 Tax=Marinobacter TaxID=2742 RepID=A0A354JQT9_9GAMM|nr:MULTISPECIES: hypothetical protein [Marinobacter]MCP4061682.1 hypothetical protein [Gammaproteobacteria bacterium]MCR9190525.1 hypothetical protein [Alteromonadaceae bacterium]MEC7729035.1 hypothetical protein [Pseudomonadota bacterium]ADP96356.1 conserved hypothetical protein [Marinobacter adhaerens HP15]AKV97239.1 hypothetical protein ACP86_14370 [Marinobacter sp. CP1]|tara:strand:+ start:692 stop:1042 length:351 start_codon:yes stop_codon:yes gene_type:complete